MRTTASRIPTLLLLCGLLALPGLADARVLCLGADGHVAVEQQVAGQCSATQAAAAATCASACPDAHIEESHCGPCVDVTLGNAAVSAPPSAKVKTHAPTAHLQTGHVVQRLARAAPFRAVPESSHPLPPLLKTTRLQT